MSVAGLIETLGYDQSAHFLRRGRRLESARDYGHVFRKAAEDCALRGVYTIQDESSGSGPLVPCVYVCEARDEAEARLIHRRVWNQNVVPFLLLCTPRNVRVYSGFRYSRPESVAKGDTLAQGILEPAVAFNEVAERLCSFRAESIDDGALWRDRGQQVTPETRVDWKLLDSLKALGHWLLDHGLERDTAHALIGKYVYLRYLRQRGILSDRKLAKWGIDPHKVFSRGATLTAFRRLEDALEDWLNGSIFPIAGGAQSSVRAEHLQRVAGTFSGDDPVTGQLHLDFEPFDFSHIPIETLSIIYEQFLHASPDTDGSSRGKTAGAYYTPIPLVNYVLEELHQTHPLREGMTVLDPACGSGTFLVQCYRRLIEQRRSRQPRQPLRPVELRDLLVKHIFGVDRDLDACRVAELSLILTLLDYVRPPDLEDNRHRFKLPVLRDRNLFRADFFAPDSSWSRFSDGASFDWIVGNPPWTELKSSRAPEENPHVWRWMQENAKTFPTGGNQVAEAFAWKVQSHVSAGGVVGLLLPAMTLFKDESTGFRREMFRRAKVWCVANFANLAYVLFRGSENPAAAFFYRLRSRQPTGQAARESVLTYAPLVANQQANRPNRAGRRQETWSIVVNASEMRELPWEQVATGEMLPWKVAMWGSHHDARLIRRLEERFPTLDAFARSNVLAAHEGFQLRSERAKEPVEFVEELVDRPTIDFKRLRHCGRIVSLPVESLVAIPKERAYVRAGRAKLPLLVSRPPHIVVHASRRFAIYSDEFIAIPARQIGIAGRPGTEDLLRALSLYLTSDFVTYHQFLLSPEWGVSSNRATLTALRQLPVPLAALGSRDLQRWADLHASLVAASTQGDDHDSAQSAKGSANTLDGLLRQLNEEVYGLLGIRDFERPLVEDLVHVRMRLAKGKVGRDAIEQPTREDVCRYLGTLEAELDGFVEAGSELRHRLAVVHDDNSAMVVIELGEKDGRSARPAVMRADQETATELETIRQRLRRQHTQWLYFDRGLRIYDGDRTYLFKPMQRMLWTRSNAILDADEVIAETLVGEETQHAHST